MIKKYGSSITNVPYTEKQRFGDADTGKRYLLEKNERDKVVARRRSMLRFSSSTDTNAIVNRGNRIY